MNDCLKNQLKTYYEYFVIEHCNQLRTDYVNCVSDNKEKQDVYNLYFDACLNVLNLYDVIVKSALFTDSELEELASMIPEEIKGVRV